jgi:hypothetical protein
MDIVQSGTCSPRRSKSRIRVPPDRMDKLPMQGGGLMAYRIGVGRLSRFCIEEETLILH